MHVQNTVGFNSQDNFFEGDVSLCLQNFILTMIPAKWFHLHSISKCVPNVIIYMSKGEHAFVLGPLAQIAPDFVNPETGKTLAQSAAILEAARK